jgi:hypothetical protein
MSYCRWSSDDFKCDVYVYAHCDGGWTTHVAGNRVVYKQPLPPEVEFVPHGDNTAWFERHEIISKMLDECDRVRIELPHVGETFSDPTPGACADRLEQLRALGYIVPQYAIDSLREEAAEAVR